jgi:exosome complex RNA-binding protein Rrp42 (RNase PH superfamily)
LIVLVTVISTEAYPMDTDPATTTNNLSQPIPQHQQQEQEVQDEPSHDEILEQSHQFESWLHLVQTAIRPMHDVSTTIVDTYWKNHGLRPDGRTALKDVRQYKIQHGIMPSSNTSEVVGSSMVRQSVDNHHTNQDTTITTTSTTTAIVFAIVTVQVGQPNVVAPMQGDIMVSVRDQSTTRSSSSSSSSNHSILGLQSFLQRILEENIDLEQLTIAEGKLAYRLMINVSIVHTESIVSMTLIDICLTAAVAALVDTRLPVYPIIEDGLVYTITTNIKSTMSNDNTSNSEKVETKPLYLPILPIAFTAIGVRFHSDTNNRNDDNKDMSTSTAANLLPQPQQNSSTFHWIADPTIEEQHISESSVTVVVNAAATTTTTTTTAMDENDEDDILCIRFAPCTNYHDPTNTVHMDPVSSFVASNNAISLRDLSSVLTMAQKHSKAIYTLVQKPPITALEGA